MTEVTVFPQPAGEIVDAANTPDGYSQWIAEIKDRVRQTRFRAARAANAELLKLYWSIGADILDRQRRFAWGAKVINDVSRDLSREFPDQSGWSPTNLQYMRKFAETWPSFEQVEQISPHGVGKLPWGHIRVILDRVKDQPGRDWYAERAAGEGWKRSVLEHYIAVNLKQQLGSAPTNFAATLDSLDSELAQQLIKDPYVFEHLGYVERATERKIEDALMDKLEATLLEFGRGFAFVGRQVRLDVRDQNGDVDEFVIDLLFFHIPQSRYVVVELKTGRFEPAFLGQLSTYVAIVDGELRDPVKHTPTIGILLCTSKNEATVRYALSTTALPIGVANYQGLPPEVLEVLPSVEELDSAVAEVINGTR